jgi:hypothetical protein
MVTANVAICGNSEATGGMVFRRKSQGNELGIHRRNGNPLGITRSWMLIQVGKIKMHEKFSER